MKVKVISYIPNNSPKSIDFGELREMIQRIIEKQIAGKLLKGKSMTHHLQSSPKTISGRLPG